MRQMARRGDGSPRGMRLSNKRNVSVADRGACVESWVYELDIKGISLCVAISPSAGEARVTASKCNNLKIAAPNMCLYNILDGNLLNFYAPIRKM